MDNVKFDNLQNGNVYRQRAVIWKQTFFISMWYCMNLIKRPK